MYTLELIIEHRSTALRNTLLQYGVAASTPRNYTVMNDIARIDPLHSVKNSETEEITISDWLDNYENNDVSHVLPQMDYNL